MRTASTRAVVLALTATAGLAAAGPASGATVVPAPGTPTGASERIHDDSALRCRLELDVRFRGHGFHSVSSGRSSCTGLLLGQPIVGATDPGAKGAARPMHWGSSLPPVFGPTRLQVRALGVPMPLSPRYQARLNLALVPSPLNTFGGGSYTGTARIRGRDHQVTATLAFDSAGGNAKSSGCCRGGRLIVDLTLTEPHVNS